MNDVKKSNFVDRLTVASIKREGMTLTKEDVSMLVALFRLFQDISNNKFKNQEEITTKVKVGMKTFQEQIEYSCSK